MPLLVLLVKPASDYRSWNSNIAGINGKCVCLVFLCVYLAGYMCSPSVLDKDGVSAAAIAGEMVSYLAMKKTSLSQQLTAIYTE